VASRVPPRHEGALYAALKHQAAEMAPTGRFNIGFTWEAIRRAGLPTTRETQIRAARAMGQAFRAFRTMPTRGDSFVPTAENIVESPLTFKKQFAWTLRYTGTDPLTGRRESEVAMVFTDRPVSLGEIKRIGATEEFREGSPQLPTDAEIDVLLVESSSSHRSLGLMGQAGMFGEPFEEGF
jgi:hypothetical protein